MSIDSSKTHSAGHSRLRFNPVTGESVLVVSGRAKRPNDVQSKASDAPCPFCPGQEDQLPGILFALTEGTDDRWLTRVVPNKYPLVGPNQYGPAKTTKSLSDPQRSPVGRHEVIIETPIHQHDWPAMSLTELEAIWNTFQQRRRDLFEADPTIQTILIFRNHGERAGTSLRHPHSQLVALDHVPSLLRRHQTLALRYWDNHQRCMVCDLVRSERDTETRMVGENAKFTVFVPYAAAGPYETWIVPKRHQSDLLDLTEAEKTPLCHIVQDVLQRLYRVQDDPDYNLLVETATRETQTQLYIHWFIRIRPRLTTPAGLEIMTGLAVNPGLPEDQARRLRIDLTE